MLRTGTRHKVFFLLRALVDFSSWRLLPRQHLKPLSPTPSLTSVGSLNSDKPYPYLCQVLHCVSGSERRERTLPVTQRMHDPHYGRMIPRSFECRAEDPDRFHFLLIHLPLSVVGQLGPRRRPAPSAGPSPRKRDESSSHRRLFFVPACRSPKIPSCAPEGRRR